MPSCSRRRSQCIARAECSCTTKRSRSVRRGRLARPVPASPRSRVWPDRRRGRRPSDHQYPLSDVSATRKVGIVHGRMDANPIVLDESAERRRRRRRGGRARHLHRADPARAARGGARPRRRHRRRPDGRHLRGLLRARARCSTRAAGRSRPARATSSASATASSRGSSGSSTSPASCPCCRCCRAARRRSRPPAPPTARANDRSGAGGPADHAGAPGGRRRRAPGARRAWPTRWTSTPPCWPT